MKADGCMRRHAFDRHLLVAAARIAAPASGLARELHHSGSPTRVLYSGESRLAQLGGYGPTRGRGYWAEEGRYAQVQLE